MKRLKLCRKKLSAQALENYDLTGVEELDCAFNNFIINVMKKLNNYHKFCNIGKMKLYVTFQIIFDETFQQTDIFLDFSTSVPSTPFVDVSFLVDNTIKPPKKEGIIITGQGTIKISNSDKCKDRWPDDGNWFFDWDDLMTEYNKKKCVSLPI
jgi:hypothetical protein